MELFNPLKRLERREKKLAKKEHDQIMFHQTEERKLADEKAAIEQARAKHEADKAHRRAERLRKDKNYQEQLRRETKKKLKAQKQQNLDLIHEIQVLDEEAERRVAEQKQLAYEAQRKLQEHLNFIETQRIQREAELCRAEEEERQRQFELEESQRRLQKRIQKEERIRQRDEVHNGNSTKALRELRELIRLRYELDMEIWNHRNDVSANRPIWQQKMVQSDAILMAIQTKVEKWSNKNDACGWEPAEWQLAEEIQQRLLAPGKREWVKNPPWGNDERRPPRSFRGGVRARGRVVSK